MLEHVLAHTASKAQLRASSNLGTEVGGSLASDLRLVTYANAAYWPLAKVLISSLAHNAPRALPSLTVMLTDPRDVAECDALSTRHGHSCFFDSDMIDTVLHGDASLANAEGSQLAGSDALSAEPSLGKALRVAWCWRKVHALYTLVEGGVPAVFLDASTAVLADPRPAVAARLADGATLVTLSDFGGAKEQEAINTGLARRARRGRRAARLLEEWMAMEPRAEDTEQAYLTWELAPEARARGDRIVALPHAKFPSYVTFDKREHIRGSGSQGEARRESGDERGSKTDAPDAAPLGGSAGTSSRSRTPRAGGSPCTRRTAGRWSPSSRFSGAWTRCVGAGEAPSRRPGGDGAGRVRRVRPTQVFPVRTRALGTATAERRGRERRALESDSASDSTCCYA